MILPAMNIKKLVNKDKMLFVVITLIKINFPATCYRNAKSFDQCKDCLMKAAECHMQNRSLFHAAKCFEQVSEDDTHKDSCYPFRPFAANQVIVCMFSTFLIIQFSGDINFERAK